MYKYIQKFPVNNILSNQLRHSPSNYLSLDKDLPFPPRLTDQIRCNYASLSSSISNNFFNLWNPPPSALCPKRQYFSNVNSGQSNILCKYYRLTQPRRSPYGTISGRISKNSFRVCTQNRGYASFFKRIIKLFKPKPSKPPKCDSVKPCPRKSSSRICVKPPPKIDFQTAVKCKIEAVEKEPCDNYMQHMCTKGIEVGYKEKPPFTSDGGQFLEDRLCREMPQKRVEKLQEEHAIKQEKLEDLAELKEIQEMEKVKQLKAMPEFKTCVKSKKKSNCAKIESSIQCDLQTKVVKTPPPCTTTAQKATSCTELASQTSKKVDKIFEKLEARSRRRDICAKPCVDPAEVSEDKKIHPTTAGDPCKSLKPCAPQREEIEDKVDPCRNIKPCAVAAPKAKEDTKKVDDPCESIEDKEDKTDPCRNIKPCAVAKPKEKVDDPCESTKEKEEDACRNIKPCAVAKPKEKVDDPCKSTKEKEEDACRNIKPCALATPKEKVDDPCKATKDKEENLCRNIKPCAAATPKEEEAFKPCGTQAEDPCKSKKDNKEKNRCGMVCRPCGSKYKPLKPPRSAESDQLDEDECGSVENLKPCIRVECKPLASTASEDPCQKSEKKSNLCRNVKPCASSKKPQKSDKCKQVKSCASQAKKSDSCKDVKPKKSVEKSDPCARVKPCASRQKVEASESSKKVKGKQDPCAVASIKKVSQECKALQEDDGCGSVENLPPCPRLDCGGSSKKEPKDHCKKINDEDPCGAASIKKASSQECKGIKEDDGCGSVENLPPCPRLDCGGSSKKELKDPCKKINDGDPCVAASIKKASSQECKGIKDDDGCGSVENLPPCPRLDCGGSSKKQPWDPCKEINNEDPCGAASIKEASQECKGIKEDDGCGSVENLPPCPRLDCGGSSKKDLKDPCNKESDQNPCDAAPSKTTTQECMQTCRNEKDDCGSVEDLPPCPRLDCGGSSKKELKDPCKKENDQAACVSAIVKKSSQGCKGIAKDDCGSVESKENCGNEPSKKMVTCSELKAKEEKLKPKTCESQKKKDDDSKKPPPPKSPTGGSCSPCPKGLPPSSLGRGIKSDIVKFYSLRDEVAGTPSDIDILTAVEKFRRHRFTHDPKPDLKEYDFVCVGMNGEHRVEAHTNLFKQCRLLNPHCAAQQRSKIGDFGLNLGMSQLMGILPKNTKFLCSQTMPNMIDHCSFSTREPRVIIETKKPALASQVKSDILQKRMPYPFNIQSVFFSEVKGNGGEAKGNGGDGKSETAGEDPCKVEKKPCPLVPCCKKEKEQCVMSSEPPKLAKICGLPKPEEPKVEVKKEKPPNPCNFEQAVKAESKHKNFKDGMCPIEIHATEVCPPKKQLCCYRKHEKPTMQGVDPCCRGIVGDVKALGCGFCKKFELLNTPPKTLPKPSVCKARPCFSKVPKGCPPKKSSSGACKPSVCKRAEIPKCPKPKFKVEVKTKPKKKPVSTMRCSNAPCYQKKCGKKKPPPPPCPTPIKPPKLEELPPTKKPCKKVKKPVEESSRRMCVKPPKRRGDAAACNISPCDADKKKAQELAEKKKQAALARQKAYEELKHTDWKAVPIKGDNRWCKSPPVVKNTKCDKELSKTLLPPKDEKYKSPRYSGKDGKSIKGKGCAKPCPSKHVRKMHSCPRFDKKEVTDVGSRPSLTIQRDYFENLASIIGEKPSETSWEDTSDIHVNHTEGKSK